MLTTGWSIVICPSNTCLHPSTLATFLLLSPLSPKQQSIFSFPSPLHSGQSPRTLQIHSPTCSVPRGKRLNPTSTATGSPACWIWTVGPHRKQGQEAGWDIDLPTALPLPGSSSSGFLLRAEAWSCPAPTLLPVWPLAGRPRRPTLPGSGPSPPLCWFPKPCPPWSVIAS